MFALLPSEMYYVNKRKCVEIQFLGQDCSKKLCYKRLHSEIVLSHRKMKLK